MSRLAVVGLTVAAVVNVAANLVTAITLLGELRHWWDVL